VNILFVSNGHGESAIALRLASEVRLLARSRAESVRLDHFPLVGLGDGGEGLMLVGPRRPMPSGGLVAMANVVAFARDVQAGFFSLLGEQLRFLRREGRRYALVVAVGDAYALSLALLGRRPTIFVGTAKSDYVASYGAAERAILRRAARIFVRDEGTAQRLRAAGVSAEAPGNVIADLGDDGPPALDGNDWIGLLAGSRRQAYDDAVRLARVVRELRNCGVPARAILSVAPSLDARIMTRMLAEDGWPVLPVNSALPIPFEARLGDVRIVAWQGPIGSLLRSSRLVIGQAGTANEAAAALGIPIVALASERPSRDGWYRMRQRRLLGDALAIVPAEPEAAAAEVARLLMSPQRLAEMSSAGIERLGPHGGAARIAAAILETLDRNGAA